jgi:hypothetical protein
VRQKISEACVGVISGTIRNGSSTNNLRRGEFSYEAATVVQVQQAYFFIGFLLRELISN